MKVQLAENGWTVLVEDFDMATATDHEINLLGCLISAQTLVIIKGPQQLSIAQEEASAKRFGVTIDMLPPEQGLLLGSASAELAKSGTHPFLVKGSKIINRVSAKPDENGRIGLFGHLKVHGWHCNKIDKAHRRGVVWLRGIEGTKGSETWFTNHILAYYDMPETLRKRMHGLHVKYKQGGRTITLIDQLDKMFGGQEMPKIPEYDLNYRPSLIHTGKSGITAFSLSWSQFDKFEELSDIDSASLLEEIKGFVLSNPKYLYKYKWEDGDMLLSDQWFGVHMRPEFAGLHNRTLHRIETDYDNIDFSVMSEALSLIGKSLSDYQ